MELLVKDITSKSTLVSKPTETKNISILSYHHTFPKDYATAELGGKLNVTKKFIDFMAFIGLAYNLKKPSSSLVQRFKDKVRSKQILEGA